MACASHANDFGFFLINVNLTPIRGKRIGLASIEMRQVLVSAPQEFVAHKRVSSGARTRG